jgi:predicted ribosome quality control (RQC) complex YloA/Tae2 family protein
MKIRKFEDYYRLNEELKPSRVHKKIEFDGYTILIGKNASMNDILTFQIAESEDLWFHVSGVPGSHVVIKNKGEEIPKEVIREAARLAAENSKSVGKTKVVYTKRKYVTKNKSHEEGQVNVDYSKSNFINVYV